MQPTLTPFPAPVATPFSTSAQPAAPAATPATEEAGTPAAAPAASERPAHPTATPLRGPAPAREAVWASNTGVWLCGAAALLLMGALLLGPAPDIAHWRLLVRVTARSSLLFFLLAYTASALAQLLPGRQSQWLLRRRRAWGLLFAGSHLLHAGALLALHQQADPALWASLTSPASYLLGGSGYLLLSLMALSSNSASQRWLGAARWQRWHRLGSHWLCLLFVLSNAKRVPMSGVYLLPVALLFMAVGLRWLAARRRSALR